MIDFFVSSFSNLKIGNLNKSNVLDIDQISQSIKSIDINTKKKKVFFIISQKNIDIITISFFIKKGGS